MPPVGLAWLLKPELLGNDEVVQLVRITVAELGIRGVRFTGGEPLLRPGLLDVIGGVADLRPRPQISLRTNGIGLDRMVADLRRWGLERMNVSLDTLRAPTLC